MTEVSYDVPVGLPDGIALLQAAQRIAAIAEAAEREEAVQTLFKLVDAVLANPEDAKKRRVKKSNETFHRKVGRHPPAIDFLRCCGFLEGDDPDAPDGAGRGALLFMPVAYLARLTDAHHTLAQQAQQVGITVPPLPSGGFNPYQSSVRATDTTRSTKAPETWKSEAEKIREEVKKRQRELEEKVNATPPVDMRPAVFWLSAGRRLEEVIRETAAEVAEEEKAADSALMQSQVATAKAAISGANSKFESADKRRLSELSRQRVHEVCILRVICPDKSVLQAHFRSGDKGEQVKARLEPLLAPHVRSSGWYLYQSPPLRKLAPKETLVAAGLTPGANMYLGFEGEKPGPPYLEDSLVAQLGPPPQDAGRGVTEPKFSGEAMGWGQGQKLGGPAAKAAAGGSGSASSSAAPAAQAAE